MRRHLFALVAFVVAAPLASAQAKPLEFKLTFDSTTLDTPFTGRVYVLIRTGPVTPEGAMSWFRPEPGLAKDVTGWKPGTPLVLGAGAIEYPAPLSELKPGKYHVMAVMDRDLGGRNFAASPGNLYSNSRMMELDPKASGTVELKLDKVYAERTFPERETVRLVDIPSPLLSKFHLKPMRLRAGVLLPPAFFSDKGRTFPVVYEITGFGGNHTSVTRRTSDVGMGKEPVIWVVLDADCRTGHHVFADSENNGPVGQALVEELIPHIERIYRGNGMRLTMGHSSGGWSSLWLQVTYPDTFAGCWSTAPDPVDFRDFQQVNIYSDTNIFTDPKGELRPLARRAGKPILFYKPFSDMEEFAGRGGQLGSFEAVFSPRGLDKQPMKLWDRKTGAIDRSVAKAWEKYDIRLQLERNWKTLGPKLAGKVHVYMGDEDTFYLDGATRLLKKSLADLKSNAVVEIVPGDHGTMMTPALRNRISEEMAAAVTKLEKRP